MTVAASSYEKSRATGASLSRKRRVRGFPIDPPTSRLINNPRRCPAHPERRSSKCGPQRPQAAEPPSFTKPAPGSYLRGNQPVSPRHRADAATRTASRRWRGIATPSTSYAGAPKFDFHAKPRGAKLSSATGRPRRRRRERRYAPDPALAKALSALSPKDTDGKEALERHGFSCTKKGDRDLPAGLWASGTLSRDLTVRTRGAARKKKN